MVSLRALTTPTAQGFVAGGLVLLSAALQALASLERWVTGVRDWTRTDHLIEDHRFDYLYPADPWEPIGAAAEVSGLGLILLGVGVGLLAHAGTAGRPRTAPWVAPLAAIPFVLLGVHAVASGLIGAPSFLAWLVEWGFLPLMIVSVGGLVWLVLLALRRTPLWSLAALLLIGVTPLGYLVSAFGIAPYVAGYQSYDTTPWTETILAAWTAAAGLFITLGAAVHRDYATHLSGPGGRDHSGVPGPRT